MHSKDCRCHYTLGIGTEDVWGDIEHTVIRVELLDGSASLRGVALSKNFLKVTEQ
jgi:hypothetical protein